MLIMVNPNSTISQESSPSPLAPESEEPFVAPSRDRASPLHFRNPSVGFLRRKRHRFISSLWR